MVAAPLEVVLSDQDKGGIGKTSLGQVSLAFGNEVVGGKAMEGALNTQGSVKLFASFAPLKLVLSNSMHVKKRGISGGRYTMHHCTLSFAEGFDGWTSYRLAYRDSHEHEHAATVIGMSDNAPMRYALTDPNPNPDPDPNPNPNPSPNLIPDQVRVHHRHAREPRLLDPVRHQRRVHAVDRRDQADRRAAAEPRPCGGGRRWRGPRQEEEHLLARHEPRPGRQEEECDRVRP